MFWIDYGLNMNAGC